MFLNRKKQRSVQKPPKAPQKSTMRGYTIKQTRMTQEFDQLPPMLSSVFTHEKNHAQGVGGVNTVQNRYIFSQKGSADLGCLFKINRSSQPGVNKSFLSIQTLDFNLFDYASTDFPQLIFIQLDGVSGYSKPTGVITNAIGCMKLCGAPTNIIRPGGIISYNLKYAAHDNNPILVDITGQPELTFHISLGPDMVRPQSYPITDYVSGDIQITDVTF